MLEVGDCYFPKYTISLPDPPFEVDSLVSNTATFSFEPLGEPRDTIISTVDFIITEEHPAGVTFKSADKDEYFPNEEGTYSMEVSIYGTEQFDDFCVIDSIPDGIEVTSFSHGGWFFGGLKGNPNSVNVYYSCLLYTSPSPRDATLSRMPSSA